jgi:hypothetical protein
MHEVNSFVTLTYNDDHFHPSLNYLDFRNFVRRLRVHTSLGRKLRYFVAGEYGALTGRPHFHALLFGYCPPTASKIGRDLYSSPVLDKIWSSGFTSVGSVTHASAAYVASYTLKECGARRRSYVSVDPATGELTDLVRPFAQMSRNPGLGFTWFQKYWREVYEARDGVCLQGGYVQSPPRYYDKLLEVSCPDLRDYRSFTRYTNSARFVEDSSPQRLLTREICALAAQKMKVRGL